MSKLLLLTALALAALPPMLGAAVPQAGPVLRSPASKGSPLPVALACLAVGALGLCRRRA